MATYDEDTSQQPGQEKNAHEEQNQLLTTQIKEKYASLPSESRPNNPSFENSLNVDEGSKCATQTKYDKPAGAEQNRPASPSSEQSKESIRFDAPSSSNTRCRKCSHCGKPSEPNEMRDATWGSSQNLRHNSPNNYQTQTSSSNVLDSSSPTHFRMNRSASQNLSPTDGLERQSLAAPTSRPEDDKLSSPKNDPLLSHSLSIDAKSRKSIILTVESSLSSDSDSSPMDKTDLPESPPSPLITSPTSAACHQKYHGDDENSHQHTISNSSDKPDEHQSISPTSNADQRKYQGDDETNRPRSASDSPYKSDEHQSTSLTSNADQRKYQGDDETNRSKVASDSPNKSDEHQPTSSTSNANQRKYQGDNETNRPQTASDSPDKLDKDQLISPKSNAYDQKYQEDDAEDRPRTASGSFDKLEDHQPTSLTSNGIPKERNELHQPSANIYPNLTEYQENSSKKESSRASIPQRSLSYPPCSSTDDQQIPQSSALHHQSKDSRDDHHIAYVPHLPSNGLTNQELQLSIRQSLAIENRLGVIGVRCNSQLDFGIIYLESKEDKDCLVNVIKQVSIEPNSDRSLSFVAELEFVSYVVVKTDDASYSPDPSEIQLHWTRVYHKQHLSKCQRLCPEFANIFRIVINTVEELIESTSEITFSIGRKKATVYVRADCCFFEALPQNTTATDLHSAINDQLSPTTLSKTNIYIQLNEVKDKAVILACNKARRWESFNSINLKGQVLMKKNQRTYHLRLRSVPSNISIPSIEKHQMFDGTVLRAVLDGRDIIVELLSEYVYEICLQKPILRIDDHTINIEANSSLRQKEEEEIDASNWYETEMMTGRSNIMQFVNEPKHRIFRLKWNSRAFLEQFRRCSSQHTPSVASERERQEATNNEQRHLLRMTVMLNTIGVLKRGNYSVNGKEIQLKPDPLKTIVYNHQSTLQHRMTIPVSRAIDYPYKSTTVRVINEDCLIVYQQMCTRGYRPLLLNMANAYSPGGGYRKGDGAQEENVFRRSNYCRSLDMEIDQSKPTDRFYCSSNGHLAPLTGGQRMYPMDKYGAIYTSGLTAFRQPEETGYEFMENPMYNVCAIAIAAYRNPKINDKNLLSSKYSIGTRKKIETIFAIAKHHDHDCLILSAFGCGAFRNPPKHIATIFKSVIEQYAGFFKRICFAVIDDHNTGQDLNPHGNYQPFHEILHGMEAKPIKDVTVDMMIGPWRILNTTSTKEIALSDVKICYLPPCQYGARCRDIEEKRHCREYLHPPTCPVTNNSVACNDDSHMLWFRHRSKHSMNVASGSEDQSSEHPKRHRNALEDDDDAHRKRINSGRPLCPWTPFYCRQHTLLAESKDLQTLPLEVQNHCRDFRHVCRYGRQCQQKTNPHWETTVHIARDMCPEGEKCSKLSQENHLNSFSHPGIADIRRLCIDGGYKCQDRQRSEHLVRYRHYGDYDRSSVIPYRGLNNQVNFVRNQQDMIATIHDYAERRKLRTPLSIPHPVLKCIQGLSPIYQCSKAILELILVHGHVMSGERIAQLTNPQVLIKTIEENKHIQTIIVEHKHQQVKDHINEYIKAIVSAEYSRRTGQTQLKTTEYAYSYSTMTSSNDNFDDTIRSEEKFLKGVLNHEELDTIRQWTIKIAEASLNFPTNYNSADQSSKKYITTVFGPHLLQKDEDIVLVFKREVMFHPDANFSIQTNQRPQLLHCSMDGYEYAATGALITIADMAKQSMDIDLKTILRHMSSAPTDQLFEGHLPGLIPFDYIEEVYIPQTLFNSFTSSAQVVAKGLFRDSLRITSYEGKRHHEYVNQKLLEKLTECIDRPQQQLRGSTITLPSSHLTEYVTLPFTLTQLNDQYRLNHKGNSLPDDIYIYWQSMYGDMMMVLSNDPINPLRNSQPIQSLMCYIAEKPSTTTTDYQETYSYLNSGHPSQHATIMAAHSFSACSNTLHRGCNVDDYLTYCLKLEKTTGQATLSNVGPNSIYNSEMISYRFEKSNLDLNELNYIQLSAGSQQVPIRNLIICFQPLPDLHPLFEKNFHPTSTAARQPKASNSASSYCSAVSKDEKSPDILSRLKHGVGSFFGYDLNQKKLTPCRDSINCVRQTSEDHCKKYSHPCRFSELCRNKDKEPHLIHEPHRAEKCASDKLCRLLSDPHHRAMFRHTGRPDFLIPCRDQLACRDRSSEHRIKYSHGEKIHLNSAMAVEKSQAPSKASMLSSESYSKEQQKTSLYAGHDEKTPCRHGSKCRDQNDHRHCSQYSHPSGQRQSSSLVHNHFQRPHRSPSAGYQANDAVRYSTVIHSDPTRVQPGKFDHNQRKPCPFGIGCVYFDATHRSKYLH